MVPLKKPRTEWGCQPDAFTSSCKVTPPDCFSRPRILSVLVPPRWAVAGFFTLAALGPDSAFGGAALALCWATRALVVGVTVAFLVFRLGGGHFMGLPIWRQSPRHDIDHSVWSNMQA